MFIRNVTRVSNLKNSFNNVYKFNRTPVSLLNKRYASDFGTPGPKQAELLEKVKI